MDNQLTQCFFGLPTFFEESCVNWYVDPSFYHLPLVRSPGELTAVALSVGERLTSLVAERNYLTSVEPRSSGLSTYLLFGVV